MQWRVVVLLAWLGMCGLGVVAEAPVVSVVPAEPLQFLESTVGESRMWVRQEGAHSEGGVSVLVRYAESFSALEPAIFECEIHCTENEAESTITLELMTTDGETLARGESTLDLAEGVNRCNFSWDPSLLSDGEYRAHVYVYHPLRGEPPYRDLRLIKISKANLDRDLAAAREGVEAVREYVPVSEGEKSVPEVRFALASDYLPVAEAHAREGDWPAAQHVARYVARTLASVRAYMTFEPEVKELVAPLPQPDMTTLHIEQGTFFAGDRPVYLFGWNQGIDVSPGLDHAVSYGLNATVVTVAPEAVVGSSDLLRTRLDGIFQAAREHNIAVTVHAPVGAAFSWTPPSMPETMDVLQPVQFIAAHEPAARAAMERYMRALLPALQDRPSLLSLSIADKPAIRMGGGEVLAAFADYVRQLYPDRLAVNRAWQTRFSDFSEIQVWWESDRPSYQYDWQTFQQQAAGRFFRGLTDLVRSYLPQTPLQMRYAANVFEEGETRLGVDPEALSALTQIGGCAVSTGLLGSDYALDYPRASLMYAYLRSVAPGQPIYNTEQRLWDDTDPYADYSFAHVHSEMWDGAIEGQDGSALFSGLTFAGSDLRHELYEHPESVEGYIMACVNINRLAPLVHAFQTAPDEVAIILSMPSQILNDGDPYVKSLVAAFEGASQSGRKVGFITEEQIRTGGLAGVKILIMPNMTAISEAAFEAVNVYIRNHGIVVRAGTTLPYDAWGHSRTDIVSRSLETVYLQESAQATQFYHAMDAVDARPGVEHVPHLVNNFFYPIEGVKSRFLTIDGVPYLYVLNMRRDAEVVYLTGPYTRGRDLIDARDVQFPMTLESLDPMLIRLDILEGAEVGATVAAAPEGVPTIPVTPVTAETPAEGETR